MCKKTLWSFLLIFSFACSQGATADNSLQCEALPPLMSRYLQNHISHHHLSGELQERTIENYLRRIDPSKVLLTQDEADGVRKVLRSIFAEMRFGNCSALVSIQNDIIKHNKDAEKTVRKIVGAKGFAVDPQTTLILDPEKRGFSKTKKEQQALFVKLVNFQISNYESAGTELDEAKEKLVHRYELFTKRSKEITPEDLYAVFLNAFAMALDPHSSFYSRDDLEDFRIQMGLSLEGIGVALTSRDGYSVVEKIIPGGAIDRSKALKPQDKIIAVAQDGEEPIDIIDMSLRDVVRLIRGKKGSKVHLTILRQDETTERFQVTVIREVIDLQESAASLRFEKREIDGKSYKLAVLDLPSFYGASDKDSRNSANDVEKLLQQIDREGADGLLLDLSRNGGGLLEEAIDITGFFIRTGGVVAVRNSGQPPLIRSDDDRRILFKGPMVVLVSRISASASEILAGAVKDYKRAVIVGDDRTFGKGSVQNVDTIGQGLGALKFTMAMFFRPGGESTQHTGVASQIRIPSPFNLDEIGEDTNKYSLPPAYIEPFLGTSANAPMIDNRWRPVTGETVEKLAALSDERVANNEEFEKIRERLAKRAEAPDEVVLADLINDRKEEEDLEKEKESEKEEEKEAKIGKLSGPDEEEEELSLQAEEALNVLADLIQIQKVQKRHVQSSR